MHRRERQRRARDRRHGAPQGLHRGVVLSAEKQVEGRVLISLDKKAIGLVLLVFALTLAAAGPGVAIWKDQYWAFTLTAVSPFLAWLARALMAERLVVTTVGIFHEVGRGFLQTRHVKDSASWDVIDGAELEVKRNHGSNQTSTSYTLVFERGGADPLRYLVGIPDHGELLRLGRVCRDHGVELRR